MRMFTTMAALLLTACSATGPLFEEAARPNNNDALVYIYRPSSLAFGGRTAHFYMNETKIADLNNGGYTWLHIPAGKHEFLQKWGAGFSEKDTLSYLADLQAGETYFLRLAAVGGTAPSSAIAAPGGAPTNTIAIKLGWGFFQQHQDTALSEIAECRYQPASKAP